MPCQYAEIKKVPKNAMFDPNLAAKLS